MKISTKGRYGVRFMIDVAQHAGQGNVTLKAVSERQHISQKYLWQVIDPLRKAGLIRSEFGPGGGYRLGRDPAEISLFDILRVLEGNDVLVQCVKGPELCARNHTCIAHTVWREVSDKIAGVLSSMTLREMVNRECSGGLGGFLDFAI